MFGRGISRCMQFYRHGWVKLDVGDWWWDAHRAWTHLDNGVCVWSVVVQQWSLADLLLHKTNVKSNKTTTTKRGGGWLFLLVFLYCWSFSSFDQFHDHICWREMKQRYIATTTIKVTFFKLCLITSFPLFLMTLTDMLRSVWSWKIQTQNCILSIFDWFKLCFTT